LKKVLFFIESLSGGGAERVLTDLVKSIDKSKFDITVMTVVDTGIYVEEVKSTCKYKSFLSKPKDSSSSISKILYKIMYRIIYTLPSFCIYRWFVKDRYDIEVAFVEGFATKVIAASNNKSTIKFAWVHVDPINRDYADHYFRSHQHHVKAYNEFDNILCVSRGVADAFNKKFNLKKKATVQYNPIDREAILQKATQQINVKKDKVTLVTVGRLTEQKGYDRLLKVCKRLKANGFDFNLWILGDGEQRGILQRYINENDLEDNIRLMGFHSNPYPYIKRADIFVCSSRTEGFSTVATEAIILGKPVITTNCAGMEELLGDSKYGIIVDNTSEALYLVLVEVLNNKNIITNLECMANERSKQFDIENNIKNIQLMFEGKRGDEV
jgi:glycosyltransferase involved in cell wall biosynthesis